MKLIFDVAAADHATKVLMTFIRRRWRQVQSSWI